MSATLIGFFCCILSSALFGSVFVPIKRCRPTDGFVTQLFLALGGFIVCTGMYAILGFPTFYPLAMLGGACWCCANAAAFLIMNQLGMALGVLIWNLFSCLTGWGTQRFGLFGLIAVVPKSIGLNYLGITILISGAFLYLFVKSDPTAQRKSSVEKEVDHEKAMYCPETGEMVTVKTNNPVPLLNRALALLGAIVCGIAYGNMVTPITYMQSHPEIYPDAPQNILPYLFSLWTGVLLTSLLIFIGYSLVKRNKPIVDSEILLPSILSGLIMGVAFIFFLLANQLLSQSIAYPICSALPGLVTAAWSTIYFKEIKGRTNLALLGSAYCMTLLGVGLVTLSKDVVIF